VQQLILLVSEWQKQEDRVRRRQVHSDSLLMEVSLKLHQHVPLCNSTDLFLALFAEYAQGQRNRSKASHQNQSPSHSFALIIVEPGGEQKANTGAQCNAGSSDEDDLCEGKLPLYHFSTSLSFSGTAVRRQNKFTPSAWCRRRGALRSFRGGFIFRDGLLG
jgi:hypothetical protein